VIVRQILCALCLPGGTIPRPPDVGGSAKAGTVHFEHVVQSIADFTASEHGAQVSFDSTDQAAALAGAARLFEKGVFRLPVARTYSLADAANAQTASATGHVAGRIVITVR
jgi:NADPH:quinone reductase-like Zn-dependent oxidoreductase